MGDGHDHGPGGHFPGDGHKHRGGVPGGSFTPGKQSGGAKGRGFGGENFKTMGRAERGDKPNPFTPPTNRRPVKAEPKQPGGRFGRGKGGANRGQTGSPFTPKMDPAQARVRAISRRIKGGNI